MQLMVIVLPTSSSVTPRPRGADAAHMKYGEGQEQDRHERVEPSISCTVRHIVHQDKMEGTSTLPLTWFTVHRQAGQPLLLWRLTGPHHAVGGHGH